MIGSQELTGSLYLSRKHMNTTTIECKSKIQKATQGVSWFIPMTSSRLAMRLRIPFFGTAHYHRLAMSDCHSVGEERHLMIFPKMNLFSQSQPKKYLRYSS